MLDVFLSALADILTVKHIGYMMIGVVVGLMIGIFPGLGGIAGLSLMIPFLYGMDTTSALAMLIGLVAVIPTSDTFASVLMGIPGSSASQATVLDGFPMAKRGEAARALSAAFFASLTGGIIGAVVLTGFVLIARPVILAFSSAELFMLSVFGLSMVGVLAGKSLVKGVAACALGLIIGSIGGAPATGEFRMVFGVDYLYDGIPLVIIGLGLFAVPEIIDLLRRDRSIAEGAKLGSGWLTGIRDVARNWWLTLRCSGIGALIGAIPGLGGTVVDWIAYGHAVQTVKDNPHFGRGDVRGVIAPESANNAKEGGGLLPTLLFGIPGGGAMAVFLGGMVLLGIQPGPSMVGSNLDLTYTIIWSLALANVLGAGLCILLAVPISRLTLIPFRLLAPFMIVVICFAAFQATRTLDDLIVLLATGVLGVYMRRFGWPRPALLIGFVLATQAETYLYQAVQFYGWEFLTRTGVMIIIGITAGSIWLGLRARVSEVSPEEVLALEARDDAAGPAANIRARAPQILFALVAFGFFSVGLHDALQHSFLGQVFPLIMASAGMLFTALVLGFLILGKPNHAVSSDTEHLERPDAEPQRSTLGALAWVASLVALTAVVGFVTALVVFFVAFLKIRARASWLMTLLLTGGCTGFVLTLASALNMRFPGGLLQELYRLPWPFS
ncbi:tripartite tricarboxylate transporter permease [Roseinatronobacter alkalisoli]|uniref:Tripartite tricarboxylate transporter permease n=1 Tax=Roseinatronobacter alkalisoli TaxID=3028235 RepID=A0ABT5T3G1_9RHOB|nr:tripartite tricarboxylate transporter permease [Roseinatronobacter sp. HJB301]MDD7969658.1 tripartite tricarboxylate transporter permease [Roseinatronobacter sp. HJB301]